MLGHHGVPHRRQLLVGNGREWLVAQRLPPAARPAKRPRERGDSCKRQAAARNDAHAHHRLPCIRCGTDILGLAGPRPPSRGIRDSAAASGVATGARAATFSRSAHCGSGRNDRRAFRICGSERRAPRFRGNAVLPADRRRQPAIGRPGLGPADGRQARRWRSPDRHLPSCSGEYSLLRALAWPPMSGTGDATAGGGAAASVLATAGYPASTARTESAVEALVAAGALSARKGQLAQVAAHACVTPKAGPPDH